VPDEDARLTDFLPDDEGEAPTQEERPPDGESEPDEEQPPPDDPAPDGEDPTPDDASPPDPGAVEPAVPTATWRAGRSCEACGVAAERRWRDGDALVCADCKEW